MNEAAIAAVQTWTFNPARKDGQPVAARVLVPVKFALDPAAGESAATTTHEDALDTIQVGPAS
jgi:hypothetical protein